MSIKVPDVILFQEGFMNDGSSLDYNTNNSKHNNFVSSFKNQASISKNNKYGSGISYNSHIFKELNDSEINRLLDIPRVCYKLLLEKKRGIKYIFVSVHGKIITSFPTKHEKPSENKLREEQKNISTNISILNSIIEMSKKYSNDHRIIIGGDFNFDLVNKGDYVNFLRTAQGIQNLVSSDQNLNNFYSTINSFLKLFINYPIDTVETNYLTEYRQMIDFIFVHKQGFKTYREKSHSVSSNDIYTDDGMGELYKDDMDHRFIQFNFDDLSVRTHNIGAKENSERYGIKGAPGNITEYINKISQRKASGKKTSLKNKSLKKKSLKKKYEPKKK